MLHFVLVKSEIKESNSETVEGAAFANKVGEARVVKPIVPAIAKDNNFFLIISFVSSKYLYSFFYFIFYYTFKNLLMDSADPIAPITIPIPVNNRIN